MFIPERMYRRWKEKARELGISMKSFIVMCVEKYLNPELYDRGMDAINEYSENLRREIADIEKSIREVKEQIIQEIPFFLNCY